MMKVRFFLMLILMSLFGCNKEKTFKVKAVHSKDNYSVEVPIFMTKSEILHREATLQFQDISRELYLVVIDEPQDEFNALAEMEEISGKHYTSNLDGYTTLLIDNLQSNIIECKIFNLKDVNINGLSAKQFQITGIVDGIEVFYQLACIQGDRKYYQVVSWTILKNKKAYASAMEKAILSFKERI